MVLFTMISQAKICIAQYSAFLGKPYYIGAAKAVLVRPNLALR